MQIDSSTNPMETVTLPLSVPAIPTVRVHLGVPSYMNELETAFCQAVQANADLRNLVRGFEARLGRDKLTIAKLQSELCVASYQALRLRALMKRAAIAPPQAAL